MACGRQGGSGQQGITLKTLEEGVCLKCDGAKGASFRRAWVRGRSFRAARGRGQQKFTLKALAPPTCRPRPRRLRRQWRYGCMSTAQRAAPQPPWQCSQQPLLATRFKVVVVHPCVQCSCNHSTTSMFFYRPSSSQSKLPNHIGAERPLSSVEGKDYEALGVMSSSFLGCCGLPVHWHPKPTHTNLKLPHLPT